MTDPKPLIFGFDRDSETMLGRAMIRVLSPPVERVFGLTALQRMYERIHGAHGARAWIDAALGQLQVELLCDPAGLARIPQRGPVVVVANHPFGGLEGLLLAQLLLSRRDDVRVLANYMLERIPDMREILIMVDPWSRASSRARNAGALKQTLRHLRAGGLLGVFPAGEVAHRSFFDRGELRESPWQESVGKIIQRAGAPVLPVFFTGENSLGFQLAGMVHPLLRTAMLPRQMLNKRGRRIEVRVGELLRPADMPDTETGAFTSFLQAKTEALRERPGT